MNTPAHIEHKLNILKSHGRERIAQEIEKQIFWTINKGGMFFHIERELDDEIAKIPERQLSLFDNDIFANRIERILCKRCDDDICGDCEEC